MSGLAMMGSELTLSPVAADDNKARYRCQASSPALTQPMRTDVNLTVHCKPHSVHEDMALFLARANQ